MALFLDVTLFLDAQSAHRLPGCKPVAGANLRLSSAANLRRIFHNSYVDAGGATGATEPVNVGEGRVNFGNKLVSFPAYHRTAAEIETAPVQKRAKFFERLSPQLDAVYIVVCHLLSP
jgi:hypothetical protein